MKKIILLLLLLFGINCFAQYDFPMKNPYVATILGSSKIMTKGVPKKIPTEEFKIIIDKNREIPANLWYEKGFKFSLNKQKKKAPLIFVLSGTGGAYNSTKTQNFAKILYNAGYNVVSVSSAFNNNFILNVSNSKVPGVLLQDGLDLYKAMESMLNTIKKDEKIEITDIYLTGYSMGATHSAVVSYLDSKYKKFNFKRVFLINPSINLYYSATALDGMLINNINNRGDIGDLVQTAVEKLKNNISASDLKISEESIYSIFEKHELTNKEMQSLIGLAFNLVSIDINYLVDQLNNTHVYSNTEPGKFSNMYPYFKSINFATFSDYLENLAYPYYAQVLGGNLKFDDI
ncbi:serine/threonine protein kinase, partial [uncultured Cetobacterium sp.]